MSAASAAGLPRTVVAVSGSSAATADEQALAEEAGRLLARHNVVVVCGGMGGVMAAVARGVRAAGGICVGLLPGDDASGAAPDLTVALPTGLGEMRNALLARAGAGLLAVGGGYGTLSEIALARRLDCPVALLGSWQLRPPSRALEGDPRLRDFDTAAAAVSWLLEVVGF
ncbi:MAG TPA: hypothetical protein VI316_00485 [Candidatus Dormibacteraeota bacterium]